MNHVRIIRANQSGELPYTGKTLEERMTGRFYTPEFVSDILHNQLLPLVRGQDEFNVIDPFCGDGRLISSFLRQAGGQLAGKLVRISLWDCDETAIAVARRNVEFSLAETGVSGTVTAICGDTFTTAPHHINSFDLCITNPPWETIKPDRREFDHLAPSARERLIAQLRSFDESLAKLYPLSQPTRKFSGWGTNLARVGTELAVKLVRPGGTVGIVCPAALFADQTSTPLRRWLFEEVAISDMAYFPAEARLFGRVDQPSVCFSGTKGKATLAINLDFFDEFRARKERGLLSAEEIRSQPALTIPFQTGLKGLAITSLFSSLPRFGDLESGQSNLWAGRELDETGHQRYLTDQGVYRFVKGRMIGRFEIIEWPKSFIGLGSPPLPQSVNFERLVWRDVSRPNQRRRVQATIIPSKWVAGNSLHVAYFRDNCPFKLRQLLAIANSLPFEAQVRSLLSTSHVSLGVIRNVKIPALDTSLDLARLCRSRLDGGVRAEIQIEVAVAKLYGLNRESFASMLDLFPKIDAGERDALLSNTLW